MTTCKWCPAPITWALTAKGHRMPLNPDVDPSGNVAVTEPQGNAPRRARVLRAGETALEGEWLTTSHHSTCPNVQRRR